MPFKKKRASGNTREAKNNDAADLGGTAGVNPTGGTAGVNPTGVTADLLLVDHHQDPSLSELC
eukprot:jgi/Psemu1/36980/gm1.36980_g